MPRHKPVSPKIRQEILRRVAAGESKTSIAQTLNLSESTIRRHSPLSDKYRIAPIVKKELIDRVSKGEAVPTVTREMGLNRSTDAIRSITEHLADIEIPPEKIALIKNELAEGKSIKVIARMYELPRVAVSKLAGKRSKPPKVSPDKAACIAKAMEEGEGVTCVARRFNVSVTTVYKLHNDAVAKGDAQPVPKFKSKSDDKQCNWISRIYPQLEDWRQLIAEWLAGENSSRSHIVEAISVFVENYLIRQAIPPRPADLLVRGDRVFPDFYEVACAKSYRGVFINNTIQRFLDWVLNMDEFADNSSGEPIPNNLMFRNPVSILTYSEAGVARIKPTQSTKKVMPYFMIHDLRRRIAQGSTFRDWLWVQGLLGQKGIDGENYLAGDWYEVDAALIDKGKADPNFVWRERITTRKDCKVKVLEAWSPVRWVATLVNLQVVARMGQIRMSDSGEADTFIYQDGAFVRNQSPLALGTPKNPRQQGILRQPAPEDGGADVLLFFNTNKTQDINKVGEAKGQLCPWPRLANPDDYADDPYYWLERLRDWQMKYNPIDRLAEWRDMPSARNLEAKSDNKNAEYLPTAFLFRTAEVPGETAWPVSHRQLTRTWMQLITAYEQILAVENTTHSDGTPIRLIDPETGNPESTLHGQRVSLITHMIIDGNVPPEIMMKIVGHQRFIMTIYYCKPGFKHIQDAISGAAAKLDATKEITLRRDLAGITAEQMRDHIVFNAEDWTSVLPVNPADRNPLGWLDQHDGICLAGGNTGPLDGNTNVPGCHNGGPKLNSSEPNGPVPGGVRNCTRCRWKCAGKKHAFGLAATLNNRQYHLHKAEEKAIAAERHRNDLLKQKKIAEDAGRPFDKMKEIRQAERLYQDAMQRVVELASDVAAVYRIIERIHALPDHSDGTLAIALQGDEATLQVVLEDTDSELLIISQICEDVEFFPNLDPGVAIFEYGQLMDEAFAREGYPLVFARMSEQEKLTAANALMRALEQYADPTNKLVARRKVVEILDRRESIEKLLGVNLKQLMPASGEPAKKVVPMRLIEK